MSANQPGNLSEHHLQNRATDGMNSSVPFFVCHVNAVRLEVEGPSSWPIVYSLGRAGAVTCSESFQVFFLSVPQAIGQYFFSCCAAETSNIWPVELSINKSQNSRNKLPPQTVRELDFKTTVCTLKFKVVGSDRTNFVRTKGVGA